MSVHTQSTSAASNNAQPQLRPSIHRVNVPAAAVAEVGSAAPSTAVRPANSTSAERGCRVEIRELESMKERMRLLLVETVKLELAAGVGSNQETAESAKSLVIAEIDQLDQLMLR